VKSHKIAHGTPQNRLRLLELRPRPRWGAYELRRFPRSPSRLERGHPFPIPLPSTPLTTMDVCMDRKERWTLTSPIFETCLRHWCSQLTRLFFRVKPPHVPLQGDSSLSHITVGPPPGADSDVTRGFHLRRVPGCQLCVRTTPLSTGV